ncbi:MAG TPA: hypothetical protein VNN74_08725 [Candidatus Micrarchaeia archaeon]|nr:hypothetical protein [Candidatus Micrarchaeia archaeon]
MADATQHDHVVVTYNGADQSIRYEPHERVDAVLKRALDLFNIQANRHLYGLFTEANVELPDGESMEKAGVRPGQLLILRQSTVRGGSPR